MNAEQRAAIRRMHITNNNGGLLMIPLCCSDPSPQFAPRETTIDFGVVIQQWYCASCDTTLGSFTFNEFDTTEKYNEEHGND